MATVRNWLMALLSLALGAVTLGMPTSAADGDPVPGSQGTDTSLPLTDSAVTVSGRGAFSELEITVNQTRNLSEQAVSITWEGGTRTVTSPGRFGAHFLQIFQCWGDDDGAVPENPGPPPEQCVFGGYGGRYGGFSGGIYPENDAITRVISNPGWENYNPSDGVPDPIGTALWRPFRHVDGTVIGAHTNASYRPTIGGEFWLNPYFNLLTTNEIPGGFTFPDGTGSELFQVLTGVQSSGLGCGQRVERVGDAVRIPKCWLVIVPRGDAKSENAGMPLEATADEFGVATSPLAPNAWKNRIAVPLEFNPVDSPCQLGQDERRLSGNETAYAAVASWQPALCAGGELPPFNYVPVGDPAARRQLANPSVGAPGMVVVSQPLAADQVRANNPVVYAPLTLSGLAIGFNIERKLDTGKVPLADLSRLSGTRVSAINLTPRLVAKLLTQSYIRATSVGLTSPPYEWLADNAQSVVNDPDFLQFNPEFALLTNDSRNVSALTVPTGNSDAAQQLWEWILEDDEARAWLDGTPDQWGMRVNPIYSTNAQVNPTGFAFGSPAPVSFPKSDPYCYQPPPIGSQGIVPPPLCGTDWLPYAGGFDQAAQITRRADDKARIILNQFAPSASTAWGPAGPQALGEKAIAAVVDSSSAARYGLQVARISNADDNGPDRRFVAPDEAGLIAAVEALEPSDNPAVVDPQLLTTDQGAYPLTMLTYAAIAPLAVDADARSDYAAFLEYAADPGQSPGSAFGNLPVGYVPLPESLRALTRTAANTVRTLVAPAAPQQPSTTPSAPASNTSSSTGAVSSRSSTTSSRGTSSRGATVSSETVDSTPPATEVLDATPEPTADASEEAPEASPAVQVATAPQGRSPGRLAVPVLGGVGLLSALAALELTKRPRRIPAGPSQTGGAS
jgi:hypothetical protein